MMTRRSAFAVFTAALVAPIAAYAQAGGLPSSTAPSNSQGTPAGGGTGVISTTQVEPTAAAPARHHTRHRRHRTHHHTTSSK